MKSETGSFHDGACDATAPVLMVSSSAAGTSLPAFVRADGGVRVGFGRRSGGAEPLTIWENGGYRMRFPRTGEGVLINTGGGMTGGDRLRVAIVAQTGADVVITSQAAEK